MKILEKRLLVIGVAVLFFGLALGLPKQVSKTVPVNSGDSIQMKTYKGSIHITPWERSEVSIVARIEPPEDVDAEYGEAAVQATEIEIRTGSRGVSIESDYDDVPYQKGWPWERSRSLPFVHYEIRAPRQVDLRLDDYKSEIEVFEIEGSVRVETYKGSVRAEALRGDLQLDTYKGTAKLIGLEGRLEIETYKGEVEVESLALTGDSRLETYKGKIELSLPPRQGYELRADLGRRAELEGISVERPKDGKIRSVIAGGGPDLEISSHKGTIRINPR